MEEKKDKKKSIFLYFIGMVFVFMLILTAQSYFTEILSSSLLNLKYGQDAIFEIVWAGFVLIVLLLFKNRYVFTQKREEFSKGFKYILPEVILSIIFLIFSILTLVSEGEFDLLTFINLVVYCIFIGIVEEFLCRGWLLNEFLERYSDTKKGTILSIVFSSLIFGLIHYLNILGGTQGFIDTTFQVINAAIGGVFLALVYYKTKNIWLVVFSHALWDLSVLTSELNVKVDCYVSSAATSEIVIYNIAIAVICTLAYACFCYWLYKKTDLYNGKSNKPMNYLIVIGVILYFVGVYIIPAPESYDDYMTCPVYETKEIDGEYEWTVTLKSEYDIVLKEENNDITTTDASVTTETDKFNFTLSANPVTGEVEFKNNLIDKKITLVDSYGDYLFVENENDFIIAIVDDYGSVVTYGRFEKSAMTNDESYLETIKNGLVEFHTPDLALMSTLNFDEDDYTYVSFKSITNERLYIDTDDKLYFLELK